MIMKLLLDEGWRVAVSRQDERSYIVLSGGRAHELLDLIEQSNTEFFGTAGRRALQTRLYRIQPPLVAAAFGFHDPTRNQHKARSGFQGNRRGITGAVGE